MIYLLLILYQIKHFVCDFPLQTPWMLGKFKKYPDFVLPLLCHAATHGVATFLIAFCFNTKSALWLALFDMGMHFTVDRVKASPSLLGRFKALSGNEMKAILSYEPTLPPGDFKLKFGDQLKSNTYFWWALGADQAVHHLTHYFIIWRILS